MSNLIVDMDMKLLEQKTPAQTEGYNQYLDCRTQVLHHYQNLFQMKERGKEVGKQSAEEGDVLNSLHIYGQLLQDKSKYHPLCQLQH